ncbi:MAG TPA: AraD1 family protein [Dongiaceae bacterium]
MRLIQFQGRGSRGVARIDGESAIVLSGIADIRGLAERAIGNKRGLEAEAQAAPSGERLDYSALLKEGRVLPPIDHPDPAHCLITGTGLTHLGSAEARDKMHVKLSGGTEALTDSLKMFKMGLEGGKPKGAGAGVQPEWFYKGDGSALVAPGAELPMPAFALDGGEEPEVVGLYMVGPDGKPWRLGYCLGNEFSDHITERQNYLWLAHSKLRSCAIGPELRIGALPDHLAGESRLIRGGETIWKKPFLSGEANMSHTVANLEFHHFKYVQFRRPGDVHIHFFGAATLSFADGIRTEPGDLFEIEMAEFGATLRNRLAKKGPADFAYGGVGAL